MKAIEPIKGDTITRVELLPDVEVVSKLMMRTVHYLFSGGISLSNPPFKGFLLHGPPGTGKTEAVLQMIRELDLQMDNVYFSFVDGSSIAAPRWGDAEKLLSNIFRNIDEIEDTIGSGNSKQIILFDDIESLMLGRGESLAKEWHYSINSIFFHQVDTLDPSKTIICSTTNRYDLVDQAIQTRLYSIEMPNLPLEQILIESERILKGSRMSEGTRTIALRDIENRLLEYDNPTIRDARQATVVVCIENGYWAL
jgi:SpoVK/Ycf46/Vps4 family AAA+-type ATPase